MDAAHSALKKYFGYDAFRLTQAPVIERTLNQQSSLVIMPTGGGKSICYQLPAVLLNGLTIVVSPLIALMQDQVTALKANGISAEALNSTCTSEDEFRIKQEVAAGELQLLYVSPERAVSWNFLQWVRGIQVVQIAIDEAHCVSIWGNDFRPEYTRLTELTHLFPSVPVTALTATADTATQQDIRQQLKLQNSEVFVSSFERKNIEIDVLPAKNRIQIIYQFLEAHQHQAGIVYCLSRRSTEETAAKLRQTGYKASHYHGAMNSDDRAAVQDQFLRDDLQIVCATIAFGMGIDKPNIRWVIHYNLPKNIESYYQEIGRAGRDGQEAQVLLFAGYGDMKTLTGFVENSDADATFKQVQLAKLSRMWEFTQSLSCRTNFILNYFGEHRQQTCGHCDHCLNPPLTFDGTIIAQKALSACLRLKQVGQSVGINMLVDVLRGSAGRELMTRGLNAIKTYGAGKDISWKDWTHYITQLIDRGYLAIDFTQGNTLHRTKLSDDVLKGAASVMLCEPQELKISKKGLQSTDLSDEESELFDSLKELRRSIADNHNAQAYTIFSDATLKDMAKLKPGNSAAFLQVSGVGEHKNEKYGDVFISRICSLVAEESRLIANPSLVPKSIKKATPSDFAMPKIADTHKATFELYKRGLSIKEISQERNLKPTTIQAHLFRLAFHGESVEISEFISGAQIEAIQDLWSQLDKPERIKTVFEGGSEQFEWEQIRYAVSLAKYESR
jgi:ATP-dependent DNA helicase RecQ